MNPLSVRTVLRDVLQACVDAYGEVGAPTIPARAYVTHGQPAWLGDQLVVYSGGLSSVKPFPLPRLTAIRATVIPAATVTIEVVRDCWPQPDLSAASKRTPHPSRYAAGAEALAMDAATIFGYVAQLATTGNLIPNLPSSTADDIALGQMVPTGPIGTKVGFRWPLTVKLGAADGADVLTGDPLIWLSGEAIEWSPGEAILWES